MQQLYIEKILIEQEHCRLIQFIERKQVYYVATRHRRDINRIGSLAGSQSLQRGKQQIMQQLDIEEILIEQEHCRLLEFKQETSRLSSNQTQRRFKQNRNPAGSQSSYRKLVDYAATRHRGDINRIGTLQVNTVYRGETSRLCSNQTQSRYKQNRNIKCSQSL